MINFEFWIVNSEITNAEYEREVLNFGLRTSYLLGLSGVSKMQKVNGFLIFLTLQDIA